MAIGEGARPVRFCISACSANSSASSKNPRPSAEPEPEVVTVGGPPPAQAMGASGQSAGAPVSAACASPVHGSSFL